MSFWGVGDKNKGTLSVKTSIICYNKKMEEKWILYIMRQRNPERDF